jgi:hypothetical protein
MALAALSQSEILILGQSVAKMEEAIQADPALSQPQRDAIIDVTSKSLYTYAKNGGFKDVKPLQPVNVSVAFPEKVSLDKPLWEQILSALSIAVSAAASFAFKFHPIAGVVATAAGAIVNPEVLKCCEKTTECVKKLC